MPMLDHLVLLVPSLADLDLGFLGDAGFALLPGGTHADGVTENVLIIFPDGLYIEVIAFTASTSPDRRRSHPWGTKKNGWIDFALSPVPLTAAQRVESLNAASPSGKVYEDAVAGGRRTLDGKDLKWNLAPPIVRKEKGEDRGVLPFWCEDVTPRAWRVPARKEKHPNGVVGVGSLTLFSVSNGLETYLTRLAPILAAAPEGSKHQFELSAPSEGVVHVFVRRPVSEEEVVWVQERGEGLWEVRLKTDSEPQGVTVGATQGARIVW